VSIDFPSPYKIIVGENGSGKTTIINALYYTITKQFELLAKLNFKEIEIQFDRKSTVSFSHIEVDAYVEKEERFQSTPFYRSIGSRIDAKDIKKLEKIIYSERSESEKIEAVHSSVRLLGYNFNASSGYVYQNIKRLVNENISVNFEHKVELLDTFKEYSILFFPTYRRIESSLLWKKMIKYLEDSNPFADDFPVELPNKELMQFGMEDVQKDIEQLTSEIREKTMAGFSSIMGSMLGFLLNVSGTQRTYSFEEDKIRIVLDRLGNRISDEDKKGIKKYAASKKLDNDSLNYLIGKLIKLYEDQRDLDIAIKQFKDTCNKYLNDKQFVYDESAVELYVESNYNRAKLDLECLSSGEKQIVSLFSKVFLTLKKKLMVIFDEPEISLSLDWQEKLLPDIVQSEKCAFLMAVTHSPFIYHNSLGENASSLFDYVTK
jgi:predicted ATPase